jgi:hypothetical protein
VLGNASDIIPHLMQLEEQLTPAPTPAPTPTLEKHAVSAPALGTSRGTNRLHTILLFDSP